MTGRVEYGIRRTTVGCVGTLALIAGTASCLHMHLLVESNGPVAKSASLSSALGAFGSRDWSVGPSD